MDHLPRLQHLMKHLQQVPYLASKNLYRVAHYFLEMSDERRTQFVHALNQACAGIGKCEQCCSWKEIDNVCIWCHGPRRKQSIICVVETWHDLCAIERAGGYQGAFHVLGGALCPLEGRGPEDLSVNSLVQRVARGGIEEVILAMNQTIEGEATSVYVARQLKLFQVRLTCLSRGLPVGASLEVMDRLTVGKALAERRAFGGG